MLAALRCSKVMEIRERASRKRRGGNKAEKGRGCRAEDRDCLFCAEISREVASLVAASDTTITGYGFRGEEDPVNA